ncbi:hypothetical protein AB1Y20_016117 [Prymnesium parvum]|uniref:Calmodulin-lysine N-methyltransferase n=1 Tax=Prymnesium parvum TaxID=97485 RepID=A0AB34K260_PRYPA
MWFDMDCKSVKFKLFACENICYLPFGARAPSLRLHTSLHLAPLPLASLSGGKAVFLAAGAALLLLLVARRRKARAARRGVLQVLRDAEQSTPYVDGSPIYRKLVKRQAYASESLRLAMEQPDEFESLFMRLSQKDVAKGCIDPELVGVLRDTAVVSVRRRGRGESAEWCEMRLPAFMAHLANPMALLDPEVAEDATPLWSDGSWTGTLIWDSAVHATEFLLSNEAWRASLEGESVLELGCGLGLPGIVCALLGAAPVVLTDRGAVAALAEEGCRANPQLAAVRGVTLEWEEAAVKDLVTKHFNGQPPGVIIACDCIFAPMFGDSFLLLEVLSALAGPKTRIIVGLERRPKDGAEAFFTLAERAGFRTTLLLRVDRVVVVEMQLESC